MENQQCCRDLRHRWNQPYTVLCVEPVTHKHTHTSSSLAVTQNKHCREASIISGGHFEATPPFQSETSRLWRAVSLLTLTRMIFMTWKPIGNQVSASLAASLLTIYIYVRGDAINDCRHDRRVQRGAGERAQWHQRQTQMRKWHHNETEIWMLFRVEGHSVGNFIWQKEADSLFDWL